MSLTFFKDPERKLSADKNKDTYALTKERDIVYVHDDKKDDKAALAESSRFRGICVDS